jgi:hypothetical protein
VANDFAFKNASNARGVELKDVQDKLGELPENFTIRRRKMTMLKQLASS